MDERVGQRTRARHRIHWFPAAVGKLGAWFIYALVWVFGRRWRRADIAWLDGPIGGPSIGDAPYSDVAAREDLTVERRAPDGGLIPRFTDLDGGDFDSSKIHPLVREFYEHTTDSITAGSTTARMIWTIVSPTSRSAAIPPMDATLHQVLDPIGLFGPHPVER